MLKVLYAAICVAMLYACVQLLFLGTKDSPPALEGVWKAGDMGWYILFLVLYILVSFKPKRRG